MSEALSIRNVPFEVTPLHSEYATGDIRQAFDWANIICHATKARALPHDSELYLVAFGSRRSESADITLLTELDEAAHNEAALSPGFVYYFKGEIDANGNCLSFCLWESKEAAHAASGQEAHRRAVEKGVEMYDEYQLQMSQVQVQPDGSVLFREPKTYDLSS